MTAAVTLENVTVSYDRHPAIHHVSGNFERASITAITGPNGAGKSTLLKAIAGIIKPQEGVVKLNGISKKDIAYLPQTSEVERSFPLTVMQLVCMGYWGSKKLGGNISADDRIKAEQALTLVGLDNFGPRYISQLSVGQFQRALFARLILQDSDLIMLDEPFVAMDENTTARLLRLMVDWQKNGKTIICVVHDIEQIISYFPNCLLIAREVIAWDETENTLSADNQDKIRTFRESWDTQEEACNT